jgi:hypothetical protein
MAEKQSWIRWQQPRTKSDLPVVSDKSETDNTAPMAQNELEEEQ